MSMRVSSELAFSIVPPRSFPIGEVSIRQIFFNQTQLAYFICIIVDDFVGFF